ncbi:transcription factor bHLH149-like [Abrus precatorius]|uniref:Transcription factor bHLH149-like n=1 Tax=Abrus precatorius TaxID=3816 RepID=A0A8B8L000_ABRPR|nr:transcription factor bHLH149-like [Abrus precatorius]
MASLHPSIHSTTSQESNHKPEIRDHNSLSLVPWTSQSQQLIYSSNLVRTLRRYRPPPSNPIAGRQIRAAADRVLAATAKGRTRWSRAILASPLCRWKLHLQSQHKKVKKSANGLTKKRTPVIQRRLPAVQKKARVLSRLIPGCRKVLFQNLLEEATDYISALEMQVRAMTALTDFLSGGAPPNARLGLS